MKRLLLVFFTGSLLCLASAGFGQAVTISVSPNPAKTGQVVTITVTEACTPLVMVNTIHVNYGDGSPEVLLGGCPTGLTVTISRTTTHSYSTPGTFSVSARTSAGQKAATPLTVVAPPAPPPPPTTTTTTTVPPTPPPPTPPPVVPTLTVQPSPSSLSVARGMAGMATITYRLSSSSPINVQMTSASGVFMAGGEAVGSGGQSMAVSLQNGSGQAVESLVIPVEVIERTLVKRMTRFTYQRNFTGGGLSGSASVVFKITTTTGSAFEIKRINLYFDNQRAEITVERHFPRLKAYVDIGFVGSGLLQGYWEVDGRVFSLVNKLLAYGQAVVLPTPKLTPLPTFQSGTHLVRFVVTNPTTHFPLPAILYFVTTDTVSPVKITLIRPEKGSESEFLSIPFEWHPLGGSVLYLIEFYEQIDGKPVFSAFTREAKYQLPGPLLHQIYKTGTKYFWKVKGFDDKNVGIGESDFWESVFKSQTAGRP